MSRARRAGQARRPGVRAGRVARVALAGLAGLAGCKQERYPEERLVPPGTGAQIQIQTGSLVAGAVPPLADVRNPYEGNVFALQEGERLYGWFNCGGCHGAIGGGSIGPPLRDRDWIYGGGAAQIYHSILEGRPNGMPAYRGMPEDSMWKLIAFVRSLGDAAGEAEPDALP